METIYKDAQIDSISKRLNVPKVVVREVLTDYLNGLIEQVQDGKSVKFLSICYLKNELSEHDYHQTLAYTCTEIGRKLNISNVLTQSILEVYEDLMVNDLRKFYTYSIRGLVKLSITEYGTDNYKLRVKKADNLANKGIRVVTLNSFRRKVGLYGR